LSHFNEAGELPGDQTPVQPQVLQALMPPGYKPLGLYIYYIAVLACQDHVRLRTGARITKVKDERKTSRPHPPVTE
jgi:hypothetical protein